MIEIILSILSLVIVSIVSVFVKLQMMGINRRLAFHKTLTYPFEISKLHFRLLQKYRDKPLKVKSQILAMPITNPAETLSSYGIMYLQKQEFIIALEQVMKDLSEEQKMNLINKLVETGILIKSEPKVVNELEDDIIYLKNSNYSLNNKNEIFC